MPRPPTAVGTYGTIRVNGEPGHYVARAWFRDLDGKALVEKTAARRWNVVFTPTIIFLPETAPEDVTVAQAAVATMPGAFGKQTFLHMFQWVHEKGYATDEHFQKFHARKLDEMRAQGKVPTE